MLEKLSGCLVGHGRLFHELMVSGICTQVGDPSKHKTTSRLAKSCLGSSGTSHVLRASAPADVMCWQCVWFSPVAGWPAGFLNIRARLGAEPVLSRTGSPDGAQPVLAAPYTGAVIVPPGHGGKTVKNPGRSDVSAAAAAPPGRSRLTLRLRLGDTPCPLHLPPDEIPIYSPVLGAAVQHLPDPF